HGLICGQAAFGCSLACPGNAAPPGALGPARPLPILCAAAGFPVGVVRSPAVVFQSPGVPGPALAWEQIRRQPPWIDAFRPPDFLIHHTVAERNDLSGGRLMFLGCASH